MRAQMGNDLPPGTSGEEVIRLYGWPTGRSAMGQREIWTFDRIRVTLENGKVVNVVPRVQAAPVTPPSRITPPLPSRDVTPSSGLPPVRPSQLHPPPNKGRLPITAPSSGSGSPAATAPTPEATRPPVRVAPPRVVEPPKIAPAFIQALMPLIFFLGGCVGLAIIGLVIRLKMKQRSLTDQLLQRPTDAPSQSPPRTFEQQMEARLGQPAVNSEEFIVPAAVSAPKTASGFDPTLIRALEWKRFELLLTLYFNATGVRAESSRRGADGGVDVVLTRPGENRPFGYVQCKAWGSDVIGVSLIREFFGVMTADKMTEGIFVTTSDYSADARAFAHANNITLITTQDLVGRLAGLPGDIRLAIIREITVGDYTTPSCPTCERKMVWREKPRFWGCPKFPACRSKPIYPRKSSALNGA